MRKIKLIHIITGLNGGGAENMLYKLVKYSNRDIFDIEVISMTDKGIFGDLIINELQIPVHTLNLERGSISLAALKKCKEICKDGDIIHGWMYHANLLSFIIAKMLKAKLVWGIHHSDLSFKNNKLSTIFIAKISSTISSFVNKIVSCGYSVKTVHESIGYSSKNHCVIPNGFETELFTSRINKKKLEILSNIEDKKIILHVARWDPLKDYPNLLGSLSHLKRIRGKNDYILVMVGNEITNKNVELKNLIEKNQLNDKVFLLGRRNDIPNLMANAHVFVSSSIGEGFPNVLGEALASKTLCVTTDTGDCKLIVDRFGEVVPVQDSKRLAEAINKILELDLEVYENLAEEGRKRICNEFDIKSIVLKYEKVYLNC